MGMWVHSTHTLRATHPLTFYDEPSAPQPTAGGFIFYPMTDTLGQLLRGAREARGETLDDVERVTHIRARQLTAIEADDFGALPSPAQARGYIKNYAQHLGLDLQDVLARYEAAQSKRPAGQATRPPRSRPDLSGTSRSPTAPHRPAVPPQMPSA